MNFIFGKTHIILFLFVITTGSTWAGAPIPAPVAGVLGPLGLAVAGIAYVGYQIIKYIRNKK